MGTLLLVVAVVAAFAAGWYGRIWWVPAPIAVPVAAAPEPTGVDLRLFGKDTTLHSQQTRKGTEHPKVIRKPHGNTATVYDLVGTINHIGIYRER